MPYLPHFCFDKQAVLDGQHLDCRCRIQSEPALTAYKVDHPVEMLQTFFLEDTRVHVILKVPVVDLQEEEDQHRLTAQQLSSIGK